jgi:localization factor PodJL
MTQSGSWSRRSLRSETEGGLPSDALEAARTAAAREGVPLERWIEANMLSRAGEPGDRALPRRPAAEGRPQLQEPAGDARREPDRGSRGAEDLSAALGEVSRRLNALLGEVAAAPPRSAARLHDTVARIGSRLDALTADARTGQETLRPETLRPDTGARPDLFRRFEEPARPSEDLAQRPTSEPRAGRRPGLDAAVAEINARQRLLDSPPQPAQVQAPMQAAMPAQMAAQVSAAVPRSAHLDADSILNLRCDIADLAHAVADLAPRRAVEALDASVRALELRVEATAPPPIDIAQLNELTRMLVEVRESVRDMQEDDSFALLSADVKGLHRRFDAIDQVRLEPAVLKHLTEQVADLRGMLEQAQPLPVMAEMAGELSQLAAKVERIGGVLGDAAATVDIVGALERKLDRLAETIAANPASTGGDHLYEQALDDIRHRLDHLHDALQNAPRGSSEVPEAIERKLDLLAQALAAAPAAVSRGDEETLGEIRSRLDQLQAALDNTARNAPMAIERSMMLLVDKLDRIQALVAGGSGLHADLKSTLQSDLQSGLGLLTSRLDQIVERLDQSDGQGSQSGQFAAIERGLNDLFAQLQETRFSAIDAARAAVREVGAGPVEDLMRDLSDLRAAQRSTELKTHDTLESVHGALERVIDRLAMLEEDLTRRSERSEAPAAEPPAPAPHLAAPHPATPPQVPLAAAPPVPAEAAIEPLDDTAAELAPELPPDHPLEPGSRAPRVRGGAPVLAPARGPAPAVASPEPNTKASFIAAARRAAQQAAAENAPPAAEVEAAAPGGLRGAIARHRTMILAGLLLLAVAGAAPLVLPKLLSSSAPIPAVQPAAPAPVMEPAEPPAAPGPQSRLPSNLTSNQMIAQAPSSGLLSPAPATGMLGGATPVETTPDLTAAVGPYGAAPAAPAKADGELPAAIGSLALRDGALAGDPAAMYEVGTRFADGRGVAQNLTLAAHWYERAALQGSMPAAYRLGSLYEKGQGLARDVQMARRYYALAAEAGNVKAMHNLAVLYAEGIDGKPDYRQASQLFRKAADRGLRDSQYNLGILYARGLGVDQNLAESFKWFALAANQGDADAQKKREDVAVRLDAQTLLAARLAVQTWTAQPVEAAANDVRPSADWDRTEGARSRKASGRS